MVDDDGQENKNQLHDPEIRWNLSDIIDNDRNIL